ncbi:MAG: DUF6495 family protein [Saprospiraceae bacterium]
MKYRRLTLEELNDMENEFVRFLVSNTVTADDWEKIKKENPERAEGLIEIFSDVVFDKVLEKVKYIEHRSQYDIKTFRCLDDKIELLGLKVSSVAGIDFTQSQTVENMLAYLKYAPAGSVQMYSAEKAYKENNPKKEIFNMLENGGAISDGKIFEALLSLK